MAIIMWNASAKNKNVLFTCVSPQSIDFCVHWNYQLLIRSPTNAFILFVFIVNVFACLWPKFYSMHTSNDAVAHVLYSFFNLCHFGLFIFYLSHSPCQHLHTLIFALPNTQNIPLVCIKYSTILINN